MAQTQTVKLVAAEQVPFLLEPWTGPHGGVPPSDRITPANCGPLAAGADFLAVSAAVWRDPDGPAAAIARFASATKGAASSD